MSRNYKNLYASTNDSIALEQAFYLKQETTKGTLVPPQSTDFLFTLGGGSITFSQPFESSPHRSGRHHLDIIKKKKELSWSFSTYMNIDESQASAVSTEIDQPVRTLYKSLLGGESLVAGATYAATVAPDITFTLFEVGDKWCRQARGCYVDGGKITLPGGGEATTEWSGIGVESVLIGIGKSTVTNNLGNSVTLQVGEGARFRVGGLVMLLHNDGVTRSGDTVAGTARSITSVVGDVITLSGAVLADADGSTLELYLSYYEPSLKTAINNPVTGLVGSVTIVGFGSQCIRALSYDIKNDHEKVDYCYGHDSLDAPYFVPANRLSVSVSMELNLNDKVIAFFNGVQNFTSTNLTAILGTATGRRLQVLTPKVRFPVPAFSVPETGSIPVTFAGMAYETVLDAADEVNVAFI